MTDLELILSIKNDANGGLEEVYRAFREEFTHWMMRYAHCGEETAREYYQAAILILYDNVHQNKLEQLQSSLKTYLFGIGKNLVRHDYREDKRRQIAGAEYHLLQFIETHTQVQQVDQIEVVSRSFHQLGEPCHSLLDMFYYQRKHLEEIAEQLHYKNTETAKNQKYKCMERLRKMTETAMAQWKP